MRSTASPAGNVDYATPTGRFAEHWSKASSLLVCTIGYALAGGVAVWTARVAMSFQWGLNPAQLALTADLAATLCIWLLAVLFNNSSFYDAFWSLFTPLVIFYWRGEGQRQGSGVPFERMALITLSSWVWGLRLTLNWATDWPGWHHEDFRYIQIRQAFRKKNLPKPVYWLVGSLLGVMVFPTMQVFMGTLPLYFALCPGEQARPLNALDIAACLVSTGAAVIQYVADGQMRAFRASKPKKGAVMEQGLWRYSRHPNYFGELSFWFGLCLHGLAGGPVWARAWLPIGVVSMTAMFAFASVPMMEKRSLQRRPAFAQTMRTTSVLIPWFRFTPKAKHQ